MLKAFFDGVRGLVILGLTRSDPFADPQTEGFDIKEKMGRWHQY
jgi:hypothetical protein